MRVKVHHKNEVREYRGLIRVEEYEGEGDALFVGDSPEPLCILIQDAMEEHGSFLSVRYLVSEEPIEGAIDETVAHLLYGAGDAKFQPHYSEITGYLWTDEWLRVGGHDLLTELRHPGRYLCLEIDYCESGRE